MQEQLVMFPRQDVHSELSGRQATAQFRTIGSR